MAEEAWLDAGGGGERERAEMELVGVGSRTHDAG